jgi:hypothetical protein
VTPGSNTQQDLPVQFAHGVNFHALARLAAGASREIEFVGVQRADDFAGTDHAFGEGALTMGAVVLGGEELPVALAEHRNFLVADQVAATLAQGDVFDAAEIDDGGAHGNQPLFAAIANT